jgi:integrase
MSGPRLRGAVWILQDRVPQDIAQRHKGKKVMIRVGSDQREVTLGTQVKFTLDTSDKITATERHREASAQLAEAYSRLRQVDAEGPSRLSDLQCAEIAGEYFREIKADFTEDPGSQETWEGGNEAAKDIGETIAGREALHGRAASASLLRRGLVVTDESRERLLRSMHFAYLDAASRVERWADGDFSPMRGGEDRYPSAPEIKAKPQITLADVRDRWVKDRTAQGKSPKTIERLKKEFGCLVQYLGGKDSRDAATVTPDDIEGWINHLETVRGLDRRTIADVSLTLVKAAFALSRRKLPSWPFEGVKVVVPKKRRERSPGYSKDEALAILRAARTELGVGPRTSDHIRRAIRWVPWICAHTGARVGEIAQLRREDFKASDGIKYIHITPEAGTTKTGNDRFVPLHPQLIEEGLWEAIVSLPTGPVFAPKPTDSQAVANTSSTKNRLREWIWEKVKIEDHRLQPNHAWRHRFITEARGIKMDSETRDRITGHEDGRASAGYGDTELHVIHEAISKMPRIEL